ncbi:MAG: hypothetical protein WCJ09_05675 [Planctomycetota bacterium]
MPPDILTFLLRGGHLNVEERKEQGLWPNERLLYAEVLDHLVRLIQTEEWFPERMPEVKHGEPVYEGTVIQRVSPSLFVCHSRRHSPCSPYVLAAQSKKEFCEPRDAAEFYLKWESHLPGKLDSWVVE